MIIYLGSNGLYEQSRLNAGMKLFLAGEHEVKNGTLAHLHNNAIHILESFYYCRDNKWLPPLFPRFKSFMLDSGAFTYIAGKSGVGRDWNRYVDQYGDYIVHHDVKLFIELDIDCVVGLREVERLRSRLEKRTGRQPIIAWHPNRGKDYFVRSCREYKYNAVGTTSAQMQGRIIRANGSLIHWFIDTAHEHGSKMHGLGYTNLKGMTEYRFDSVDSTAWLFGNRGGFVYIFDGRTMQKRKVPPGMKLRSRDVAIHNFCEWVKFQKYAEAYL